MPFFSHLRFVNLCRLGTGMHAPGVFYETHENAGQVLTPTKPDSNSYGPRRPKNIVESVRKKTQVAITRSLLETNVPWLGL